MNMQKKRKIVVIVYEYFYPGFLAGGPIQSLCNLLAELQSSFEFRVITSAFDLNAKEPYPNVRLNEWNEIQLPNTKMDTLVWYHDSSRIGPSQLLRIVKKTQGDILFINGLFTPWSTWPLIFRRAKALSRMTLVVSPRGMLQEGALKIKPWKKRIYLFMLKSLNAFRNVHWHTTDEQEKWDVQKVIGQQSNVLVAPNIPKRPAQRERRKKLQGRLRLIFLSLISPKKNLLLALQALVLIDIPVSFHIYGPIKDPAYWELCKGLMKSQTHEIVYCGTVEPNDVQGKLADYDAFVLPTSGENFGHAIYEALSVGTPVIISQHTPWGNLEDAGAGITVKSEKPEAWAAAMQEFISATDTGHASMSKAAFARASDYYYKNDFVAQYNELFA